MKGQIVRIISGFYDIVANKKEYRTRGSGNLRNLKQTPVVGDFVEFEEKGLLTKIYKRSNFLTRPKIANVDQIMIVSSLKEPNYSSFLLNKFLAIVEFNKIKPIILFTKTDLVNFSLKEKYESQGYEAYEISNKNPATLKVLNNIFQNKLTVLAGQTGVGKTSTINNLTKSKQKTQSVSKSLGRGKHTTRVVEIIFWNKGCLIDTPGFSALNFDLTKLELANSYHDFKKLSKKCKFFKNCIHNKEKDCAIKNALQNKTISKERYKDYLKLLEVAKKWKK